MLAVAGDLFWKKGYEGTTMRDIAKAMKDAGTITVYVGQDHPIRFDFEIEDIEGSFMIAPRLEAD